MARRVIGLDLGAYSVKLVRLEVGKQTPKFEVVTVIEEILPVDDVVDVDKTEESEPKELQDYQREAIQRLASQGFLEAETYAIGLDAHEGQMRTLKVPPLDNRKIDAVLPGLLETEVPYDVDDMIVSWHRVETEKLEPSAEPPESVDIRIAFGKKPAVARALSVVQPSSVDPRIMHLTSTAPYEIIRELGYESFVRPVPADAVEPSLLAPLSAIIDFGHRATNLVIFDKTGVKLSRSFLQGGKELSEAIAEEFAVPFKDAQDIKHHKIDLDSNTLDDDGRRVTDLAKKHFNELFDQILRTIIVTKASNIGEVVSVAFIGGACSTTNFMPFMERKFHEHGIMVVPTASWLPTSASSTSTALALGFALSGLQVHAKDSRFNFRKDEFAWRGELDFVRSKSVPLTLWALTIVCSLIILWSAISLVLDKENEYLEARLQAACSQILNQKNIAPKKCLTLMKEQIASHIDFGIPEYTATDLYVKMAEFIPKELAMTISELDVMEKKVRINAETTSFADVDKIVASLSVVPCLVKIERGRAQQVGNVVKFSLSSDIDCNVAKSQPTTATEPDASAKPTPEQEKSAAPKA